MKGIITTIGIFLSAIFFVNPSFATTTVNEYLIDSRPIAKEPSPQFYSILANAVSKPLKPYYNTFTLLQTHKSKDRFSIPPFPYTEELPSLGNWMVAVSNQNNQQYFVPAHWIDDLSADGRFIIEPINYLFVVYDKTKSGAIKKLQKSLEKTGFLSTWSGEKYHSGNYHAYINHELLSQLKNNRDVFLTFSNNFWLNQNDHFRVMGTFQTTINHENAYLFLSSVSEESNWDIKKNAGHYYVSFVNARNNLAHALIKNNFATYYVILNNFLNTKTETTEDHDGKVYVTVI